MGTTPTYQLPYPANTDPATNGAAAIQALATAVEAKLVALRVGCCAYRSAALSPAHNATQLVSLDAELYDGNTMHDPALNPSRVTVKADGRYQVSAIASWAANATGARLLRVGKNLDGAAWNAASGVVDDAAQPGMAGFTFVHRAQTTLMLTAGDRLELYVAQTSGAALALVTGLVAGAPCTGLTVQRLQ